MFKFNLTLFHPNPAAAWLNSSKDIGSVCVLVEGKAIFGLYLVWFDERGTIAGDDCSPKVDDGFWETAVVVFNIGIFIIYREF